MAGNFQPSPRKKIALDNRKLSLSAPVPNTTPPQYARLDWGLFTNNPRITVYTNDPNDQQNENGKIAAHLDARVFMELMQKIYTVVDGPNGYKEKLDCNNYTFYGGQRSKAPELVSEVWFGKDDDGVVWISVVDAKKRDRPKIKFKIQTPDFHRFVKANGEPFSPGEGSLAATKGYVRLLENLMTHLMVMEYKEPEPKGQGGGGRGNYGGGGGQRGNYGGGGGGYNRGGNQGGGSDDSGGGDEIPF